MKDNTINIRTSEEDEEILKQAAENLSILTDEKPSLSKAIRAGVKLLADQDPTKPELFHIKRNALRGLEANLEYGKAHLQLIVDEYVRATGSPPTMEEIESWFGNESRNFLVKNSELIKEGIRKKLYAEQQKLNPTLQFNIILPDLEKLFEACSQLIFVPMIDFREMFFWQCYTITEGRVELLPVAVEAVKDGWRVYAVTPEEKARLGAIRKLCAVMDTIKLSRPSVLDIPGVLGWDDEAGVYSPHENYIKGYIK
jgi:uncharacterized protein (DUF1778 family)